MNEELEVCKAAISSREEIADIYSNPVVQFIAGCCTNLVPGAKDAVDAAFQKTIERHQKQKLAELFEIIMADGTITMDDVRDVRVIFEFARLIDIINHLSNNAKVQYLGNLMRESIDEIKAGNVDAFEERLGRLDMMSEREIYLTELLFQCEREQMTTLSNEEGFMPKKSWAGFQKVCGEKFEMNTSDVISSMQSITRTGLVIGEWYSVLDVPGACFFYTTPEYHRLRGKIYR